jgi:acyl-homoserine lactone synthase
MVQLVETGSNIAGEVTLRSMYAARKEVFIDLLKWDLPVLDGRFELDQFDDQHAHYLIIADRDGAHLGSARILPTTRPHILDTLFPELAPDGPPRGLDVHEITDMGTCADAFSRERPGHKRQPPGSWCLVEYRIP